MRHHLILLLAILPLACHRPAPEPTPEPTPVPVPTPTPVPDPTPRPDDTATLLLDAHNRERASRGLPAFTWSKQLQEAAQKHADYMARIGRMAHMGIGDGTPWSRIDATGYRYSSAGENVAWNQQDVPTVMNDWMHSPGHRAAILGSYAEFGGAVAYGTDGAPFWTCDFGTPGRPAFGAGPEIAEDGPPTSSEGGRLIPPARFGGER